MDRNGKQCFVCDTESTFHCNNIFSIVSKHTETPIYKFLEKFLDESLSRSSTKVICQDCLLKIDDFDLYQKNALRIERELIEIINRTHNRYENVESVSTTKYVKEEIEDDSSSQNFTDKLNNVEVTIDEKPVLMKCNVCLESFASMADMKTHSHNKEDEMKCDNSIEEHYVTETLDEQEYEITTYYDTNEINDNDVDDVDYKPELSIKDRKRNPKSSPKEKKLKITTKGPHKCEMCEKVFLAKSEFRIHMKTHEESSKLICYICGMTYKSKTALDVHVGLHQGLSPHECAVCGKKFTQKGALVRHMPIHTGERPYQCDKCGKQFLHYSSFHMHQLAHDDIREKKCTICGLQLRSNSHLTRHMRVHSGEKPYSCPTCGQKFAQRYNMMTHYKAHQGIHRAYNKNHVCPICNFSFQRKIKLEEHLSQIHKAVSVTKDDKSLSSILQNTSTTFNLNNETRLVQEN